MRGREGCVVGEGGQPEVGCTFYKGHCYVTDTIAIHSTGRDGTELVGSGWHHTHPC